MNKIAKLPHEKNIARPAYNMRRDHPVAGVVGGSTVLASPAAAIEAHGNAGAAKRLTETKPHPSMAGNTNRGFATRKGVPPVQPINANPATGRPTVAPAVHTGATGRRSAGADTPGESNGVGLHSVERGDTILAEAFANVNNRLPTETAHHSTTTADIIAEVEKTVY